MPVTPALGGGAEKELSWVQSLPALQSKTQFQIANKQKSIPVKFSALWSLGRESQNYQVQVFGLLSKVFYFCSTEDWSLASWMLFWPSKLHPSLSLFFIPRQGLMKFGSEHMICFVTIMVLPTSRSLANATVLITMSLSWSLSWLRHHCHDRDVKATVVIAMPLSRWLWCWPLPSRPPCHCGGLFWPLWWLPCHCHDLDIAITISMLPLRSLRHYHHYDAAVVIMMPLSGIQGDCGFGVMTGNFLGHQHCKRWQFMSLKTLKDTL